MKYIIKNTELQNYIKNDSDYTYDINEAKIFNSVDSIKRYFNRLNYPPHLYTVIKIKLVEVTP